MQTNLQNAQKIMLSILVEFERICSKHNLIYWLDYGTLLGAIRHKGFIPWDDDLDVSMPREDYEIFLQIASSELDAKYFLQNKNTDKHIYIHYSKIRFNQSLFVEKHEIEKKVSYNQGIYIDIFPINYIKQDIFTKYSYIFFKKCTKLFSNRYIRLDILTSISIKFLNSYHNTSHPYSVRGGEKMSDELSNKNSDIFPLEEHSFEDFKFKIPHDYVKYLTSIYGQDYMTLPTEEQRESHSHSIHIYNKEHRNVYTNP